MNVPFNNSARPTTNLICDYASSTRATASAPVALPRPARLSQVAAPHPHSHTRRPRTLHLFPLSHTGGAESAFQSMHASAPPARPGAQRPSLARTHWHCTGPQLTVTASRPTRRASDDPRFFGRAACCQCMSIRRALSTTQIPPPARCRCSTCPAARPAIRPPFPPMPSRRRSQAVCQEPGPPGGYRPVSLRAGTRMHAGPGIAGLAGSLRVSPSGN